MAGLENLAESEGVKRPQVDHPLPPGEGRGEGTALHVEACCGRGHSTWVTIVSSNHELPFHSAVSGGQVCGISLLCSDPATGSSSLSWSWLGQLAASRRSNRMGR